jgi:hypothetical protein
LDVCDDFFRAVFGISKGKLKGVRALLKGEGTLPAPHLRPEKPNVMYTQCVCFWSQFFDQVCQRANKHLRLFPVNASFPTIYEDHFIPWFEKVLPGKPRPCLGYFTSARRDPQFADVKSRAKHHHCRCKTCANLQARRLTAFGTPHEADEYKQQWEEHEKEKREWRQFEQGLILDAKHNPDKHQVLWFDDTSAMGLPRFTNRTMKNLPIARFDLIPALFADLGRGRDYYVYTAKGRFKKGANRLCTALLSVLRASKNADGPSRKARKLTLIADNFAENKNNEIFAFCNWLVVLGWYDEINLVYGPPGHTHNGGDQQHQIHNVVLGNFTSLTLPHLLARYPQAWRQEHTRPTPCILDVQYDWKTFFAPFIQKVAGFTKTAKDPIPCRGFKIQRGQNGIVEMLWKTKAESGEWCGVDGKSGTPGFIVLKGRPFGVPAIVQPNTNIMQRRYWKQLFSNTMRFCINTAFGSPPEADSEAIQWLKKAAKHGVVPIHCRDQEKGDITPGELGSRVTLKCGEVTAKAYIIEDTEASNEEFWFCPSPATIEDRHSDSRSSSTSSQRLHPNIGYAGVPPSQRPTWQNSAAQDLVRQTQNQNESDDGERDNELEQDSGSGGEDDSLTEAEAEPGSRKRNLDHSEQKSEKERHDVIVMFGEGEHGNELWLALKLVGRRKNHTRLQYLRKVEDGMYEVTGQTDVKPDHLIKHTFEDVSFISKTIYKLTKTGKRRKNGSTTTLTTELPFNSEVLSKLDAECGALEPGSE